MKVETKARKNARRGFRQITNDEYLRQRMHEIIQNGTGALNQVMLDIGKEVAQTILCVEREELAGPDYHPSQDRVYKWAFEPGSIYLGDQKVSVMRPRLRGPAGEVRLKSYAQMKSPQGFYEQLLGKVLGGLSERRYAQTVVNAAEAFGVSASTVSRHLVEIDISALHDPQRSEHPSAFAKAVSKGSPPAVSDGLGTERLQGSREDAEGL